jgi:hypothetical protein
MPRKMKKLEGMSEMPSRQDIPGAEMPKKRSNREEKAERLQAETSAAVQDGLEEETLRARLEGMSEEQAFTSHEAADQMLKAEKKKQFLKMKGKGSLDQAREALEPAKMRERVTREAAQEKVNKELLTMEDRRRVVGKMADAIDLENQARPKAESPEELVKELRDIEESRQMEEEVLGYVEKPKKRVKKQEAASMNPRQELVSELVDIQTDNQKREMARKEAEDLDREWAERLKRDIKETEAKTSELMKSREVPAGPTPEQAQLKKAREIAREATASERIAANVQTERASAETDPARKRAIARVKKLESEQAATAQLLRDLTGMEPEDAYEKLVLNAGFWGRIQRGMAALANTPTYKMLDYWHETGSKLEEANREVMGVKPDYGQEMRASGLRNRADEEMVTKAAIGREDARAFRRAQGMKPLDTSKRVGETSDEVLMEDQPMGPMTKEDAEIAQIDADYFTGKVRDAEGNIITDEKKIRAKRPMSRVPGRKVSMGSGGVADAMSRAEGVRLYQPGAETPSMPEMARQEQPAEENVLLEYQKERATDINTVRKQYPRAAELWNSIASRLQGIEQSQFAELQGVFGTRDLATAYVLDRAFYDMDGNQESKARLAQADKILGIEEISPKKVRPKVTKKAA